MDQTRKVKNHLKVTEGLLALTKTRLKKKKSFLKKRMCPSKGHWSAVETENFTGACAHVLPVPWKGDDTQT